MRTTLHPALEILPLHRSRARRYISRLRLGLMLSLLAPAGELSSQVAPPSASPLRAVVRELAVIDSLYSSRDTTALARQLNAWKGQETPRIRFYRGMSAAWSGRYDQAISLLRPVIDSSRSVFARDEFLDAMRALSQSYSRSRNHGDATSLYEAEINALDSALDSAAAAAAARSARDSTTTAPILKALTSPGESPPPSPEEIPTQLGMIGLLFALFLIPKLLQRFRIPGAVTSLVMGAVAVSLGWFEHDATLSLLSTLGIVSLFLFAGLEIDGPELRRNIRPLALHAAIWTALATITAVLAAVILGISARAAALVALAIVTPSTGFILSSLSSFGLTPVEQKTVRTYAIGSELIALTALFFVLQTTSLQHLLVSIAAMAAVIIVIPLAFRAFASVVAPYAPRSEFAFLLMVGVASAYATTLLGVYYLVGAFLVGVAAQRFRGRHPAMSSERMVDALEAFGSVFIPFYFFHAGTEIVGEHLTVRAFLIGSLLIVVLVPVRIAVIALHRRIALREPFAVSRRVASAMVPTLVFTLVIDGILVERFGISAAIAGALVLYTVLNTTLPAFVLRAQPADFEDVEAIPLEHAPVEG